MDYKFKVGDEVITTDHYKGTVINIDGGSKAIPYKVALLNAEVDWDWYAERHLERIKTVSEPSESLDATQVSTESKQAVVEPPVAPVASEGRKYDSGKPRYSLLPSLALEEVVHVLTFGSQKYEDFNWMKVQNANDRYFSAANRHLWQWKRGEIMDSETKRHHLASAITNLMFILELELQNATRTE